MWKEHEMIYGDYVANILWLEKPLAFVTKHKTLANNYRKYFNACRNPLSLDRG